MTDPWATALLSASQHGPRPLPLFLSMLRSETAESPDRMVTALAGLRRYQQAPRKPRHAAPVRFRSGRACLRDYGGGGAHDRPPVVFVPSLINPPFILDLMPGRSMLRWLAAQGHRVWLLDWGVPGVAERDMGLAGHVEQLLLPLVAQLPAPPVLVGYCLGGTMSLAAAACHEVAGVATIAAPWRFDGYDPAARTNIAALWAAAEPACAALGLLPMEVLQTGFWQLDPARTIAKYEAFATLEGEAAEMFVAMEDWANSGAPLTYAAGEDLFGALLQANQPGNGGWQVGGVAADPLALACPTIEFVSRTDRIVPAETAIGFADQRLLGAGHVGMVVGGSAKAQLWNPLSRWIAQLLA